MTLEGLVLLICLVGPLSVQTPATAASPQPAAECGPGLPDCTPPDSCTLYFCSGNGHCLPYSTIQCYDNNPCTEDWYCPNRQCDLRPYPDGRSCQLDACNLGGACQNAACVGTTPVTCNDNNPCTADACDPQLGCTFTPISCDDGNPCTADSCSPATGACVHTDAPQVCDDGSACTTDVCSPTEGCLHFDACDDGNACTRDVCMLGNQGCAHTAMGGIACDDGNECTIPDTCVVSPNGEGLCVGTPPSCPDDGDACTDEVIDPVSCLCEHLPHGCPEAGPVSFADGITLQWSPSQDATSWNTYRGTIPTGLMGSRLPASAYDHGCFEPGDAFGDGTTTSGDAAIPPLGTGFYYFVSGENACGESVLGSGFSGAGGGTTAIPNASPCP